MWSMMRLSIIFSLCVIVLSGCENSIYEKIKEEDILNNGGLSFEFRKLENIGIRGYSKNGDKIIFYVDEPNEKTRGKIEEGLIKIFGQTIDFTLQDSDILNIEFRP